MLLGQGGGIASPSKNDIEDGAPVSPWTNLITVGFKVLSAILGGNQQSVDGIDKVDTQSSPMQVKKCSTLFIYLYLFIYFSLYQSLYRESIHHTHLQNKKINKAKNKKN